MFGRPVATVGVRAPIRALAIACLALASVPAFAHERQGRLELIVRLSKPLGATEHAKLAKIGAYVYRHLPIIESAAVCVPVRKREALRRLPFVSHVSPDGTVRKTDAFTESGSLVANAWTSYGVSGRGIGIAVIDSGVRADGDLGFTNLFGPKVVAQANFSPDRSSPDDTCGHGTHVAGIAVGTGTRSSGDGYTQTYRGIAPGAHLISARVLDSAGQGKVSQVLAGISWVIERREAFNVRVMNLSIGHEVGESYRTDPLCRAVEAAWRAGIVVVCAAGNGGRLNAEPVAGESNDGYGIAYGSIQSPANSPYAITVGAMRRSLAGRGEDTIATYSSRGPTRLDFIAKPDLVAPGNGIVSVLAQGSTLDVLYRDTYGVRLSEYMLGGGSGMSSDYFRMSGTSMAAPVVAGAVALMLEREPGLDPSTVKARLMQTADKWAHPNGEGDAFSFGAGYLNIPAALASTLVARSAALSPATRRRGDGTVSIDMAGIMAGGSFWGTGVRGADAIYGQRAMWGTGSVLFTSRAMWGTATWSDDQSFVVDQAAAALGAESILGDR